MNAVIFLAAEETSLSRPSALCELASRPVLDYAMEAASAFDEAPVVLLSGSLAAPVETYLQDAFPTARALQGHGALQKWQRLLDGSEARYVLLLEGNRPFMDKACLKALALFHEQRENNLTLRGSYADGSVDVAAAVVGRKYLQIVLERFIGKQSEAIGSSASLVSIVLDSLDDVLRKGMKDLFQKCGSRESLAVSDRKNLAKAEAVMQDRLRQRALQRGVCMQDPGSVYFSFDTKLGKDTIIEPHVFFARGVKVGRGVRIRAFSHLAGCKVADCSSIGPYARLRPESKIRKGARIGNFVELKQADVGEEAKIGHLSYVGDAKIGARANIGAGVITCNFDGKRKNRTSIGEDAFIGSNASLIAPVRIGKGSFVGAGSVITRDVKAGALALERSVQVVHPGWVEKHRKTVSRKVASKNKKGD